MRETLNKVKDHYRRRKKRILFILLALFLIAWITLLSVVGPQQLVNTLGVHNSYLLIFLIAALGGFSSLSAISFFTTLVTLATGGINPLLLSLIAGMGLSIGDSFFYYLGYTGRGALPSITEKALNKVTSLLQKTPRGLLPLFIFIYAAFIPFTNDILMIAVALVNYPYRYAIGPLLLGNVVFCTIIVLVTGLF